MPASRSRDTRQSERTPRAAATAEPLRGEAAWRAQLKEIAQRNEAACAAGARRRAAKEAKSAGEAADRARHEMQRLRDQAGS